MNKENAAKWVAALRSGEFKQTSRRLRKGDSFCCLGVLCELYAREHEGSEWSIVGSFKPFDGEEVEYDELPMGGDGVAAWIGDYEPSEYATLNDHGLSFAEIADAIERDAGLIEVTP